MTTTSTITATDMIAARQVRDVCGFLTPAEVAQEYGIPLVDVVADVDAAQLCSLTYVLETGERATFVPTQDGAVQRWIEEHR